MLYSALNRAGSVEARRNLLHATLRESWDSATLESLNEWLDTEGAKQDLPEIEIVAFFKQMPPNLRKKLGYKPADADWWLALTDFLQEKEAWLLAEAAHRKAIELDPADAYLRTSLGRVLAKTGRGAEAEAAYRKAIELNPKFAIPWVHLGYLLEGIERGAGAEAAYRKAIELTPSVPYARTFLGDLLVGTGRPGEAEAAYRKSTDLDRGPGSPLCWLREAALSSKPGPVS
jgi:Flp pilus assembly protein TadD